MNTLTQNYSAFIPTLFDARFHGCYSFESVLAYHKSIDQYMPQDGLIWLCEHPNREKLIARQIDLSNRIKELENGMKGQVYLVWTTLDHAAHILRSRLQLVYLCISNLKAN